MWTLAPGERADGEAPNARITAGEAAEGRIARGVGLDLEPCMLALPPTGWTVAPDPDLTAPRWIGAPETAAKDRPECSSPGFGPGWAIEVGMTEPVLLVGRVSRAPQQPPEQGWLTWPGSWTNEDLRFMVREVYGDADLDVWAVDAAGNVSAEPLRLQVRGDLLTVAPPTP